MSTERWKEERQKQSHEALTEGSSLCSTLQAAHKVLLTRAEHSGRNASWVRAGRNCSLTECDRGDRNNGAQDAGHLSLPVPPVQHFPWHRPQEDIPCVLCRADHQNARNSCPAPDQQVREGCPKLLLNQYHNQLFRPCLSFASSSPLLLLLPHFLGLLQPQLPV